MVWRILKRPTIYKTLSTLFLSGGIVLACFLFSRFVREGIDTRIVQQSDYLIIAKTPAFALPPATPLPTLTPTPTPTATPLPLPAVRLSIPAIGLNSSIKEAFPTIRTFWTGSQKLIWEPVAFAVGHYNTSGYPGEGRNIVLAGHNNMQGAVFQHLSTLRLGDEVILFTADSEFHYHVEEKIIIPYLGAEAEGNARLQSYASPQSTEMVTLISCWPYATNADRIVVIAVPSSGEGEHAH